MKAIFYLFVSLVLVCCNNTESDQLKSTTDTISVKQISISEDRANPEKNPIAVYAVPVDDGMGNLNNWKFAVNIYETTKTFNYKVNVQYKEIRSTEIIQIPNFNTMPAVSIKPGKSGLDCMIGFNDSKGLFKEYIQVSVKNEQLKVKKVNSYAVRSYQRKLN
ncbi:MAG TPA: hypothetical protein VJA82_14350 [Sediminibacterium sp.]|uniref:hypothetical protein n=1 Tax=Sediminibacterium sp. TaxID=1917865 RepID=UPI0008CD3B1C|nr:hypothetical protein [Sediminibacterium sp.]OHC86121.1 MAG: hypothetical protein A2472_00625 [Sphingobacteriia bacterium RIFOXYC2_FULL_35_18]OHC89634.1 MAG: hypothetical protein A2546_09870 [Sphingobacteriia bacterium RIFOXYD2_FULL_35_12]HLD54486.1 hypothetical protein [Sediminibacterium sp.]